MDKNTLTNAVLKHLKDIETFKYAPFPTDKNSTEKNVLDHSNIITKDYFYTVVYPFLNANTSKKPFTVIYGDFNKLNYINTTFSEEIVDKALTESFESFPDLLPSGSIIARLGGDEIVFILFDTDESKSEEYIDKILNSVKNSKANTYLKENNSEYEFGITLGAVDSTNGNLKSILELAENKVTEAKHNRNISENSRLIEEPNTESILNEKIQIFIKNHIANLRFSEDYNYTLLDFKKEASFLINLLNEMIDNPEEIDITTSEASPQYFPLQHLHSDPFFLSILENLCNGNLTSENILKKELSFAELAQLESITYEILENLIRDSNSHLLNKSYLKKVLTNHICNNNEKYQAFYCSDVGIKRSNSAYTHALTDKRIQKTAELFLTSAAEKFNFNNHPFEFSRFDNFIIDQGGGNYLILINSRHTLLESDFKDIADMINCIPISKDPENTPFQMSYAMYDNISTSDPITFLNEVRELKKACNKNKDAFKSLYLNDRDTILALKKEIYPCVQYYTEHVEEFSGNFYARKRFLEKVLDCFLNEISCYDQSVKIKSTENKTTHTDDEQEPEL